MTLRLPAHLAAAVAADGRMRPWAQRLPAAVADIARRWSLTVGAPYEPGGVTSWVAPVRTPAGEPAALKVTWRHVEGADEAAGLRAWDADGVVRLLAHARPAEDTDALLLERCAPGTPLSALPGARQDAVLAGLLRRLWIAPPAGTAFRPLLSMCELWVAGVDPDAATAVVGDRALVEQGLLLFRELAGEPVEDALLVTDLHAGNILSARREPWLVIDPKPYRGDRCYDPLQHLLNSPDRLVADPHALVAGLAGRLGLDPARLARWLFARAVVECVERPWLAAVVRQLRPA